ncbi:MAG: hypothetical protein ACXW20_03915, partial [Burkholderiales bacterium]
LYTGDAGETLVPGVNVPHAYSSDHTIVEFAVPLTAIGSPAFVTTLWDVNNATFLPTDFSLTHYEIGTDATALASAIVPRSATSAPNVGAGAGSVLSLADVFVGTPTVSDVAAPRGTVQLQPALTLLLNDESATAHLLTV